MKEYFKKIKDFYLKHERYAPAFFFLAGFLFDIVTLDRIDSLWSIIQQTIYLILASVILLTISLDQIPKNFHGKGLDFYLQWRSEVLHFIYGSLLSSYTLFFFKSSSFGISFIFLLFLLSLLIANELPAFKKLGPTIKYAIYMLCMICFFSYLIPILLKETGSIVVFFSTTVALFPLFLLFSILKKSGSNLSLFLRQATLPSLAVYLIFMALYFFKITPPVPLSIQYIGIYHSVEKSTDGKYQLTHYKPWWRFWHSGDQYFLAKSGDAVVLFFRLFSPSQFEDDIYTTWYLREKRGWVLQDRIKIKIVGGREEGFRGFTRKSKYIAGDWQARVETVDGREIGRISFKIEQSPLNEPIQAKFDIF